MRKKHWAIGLFLSLIILVNFSLESKAFGVVNSEVKRIGNEGITVFSENGAGYIVDLSGRKIELDKLPSFSSQEEADEYVRRIKTEIQRNTVVSNVFASRKGAEILGNSSSGVYTVDQRKIGIGGYIKLNVSYTTSGPNNGGSIIEHNAYTTFTGITYSFSWNETTCTSKVSSSGKDIIASASGELVFYLLVNNILEVYREEIRLSGICPAAR